MTVRRDPARCRTAPPQDPIDAEIKHHLSVRAERLIADGWSEDDALEEAKKRFGSVEDYEEELRKVTGIKARRRGASAAQAFGTELRFTLRQIRRSPVVSLVALLVMTIGIGTSTAVYSLVDGILLQPLAFRDPDRVVSIREVHLDASSPSPMRASLPAFETWREGATAAFEGMVAISAGSEYEHTLGDDPRRIEGAHVSHDFFGVLGIPIAEGRGFLPEEDTRNSRRVVVIRESLQRLLFGEERGAIGRTVELDGDPYEVVGVVRDEVAFPSDAVVWAPITPSVGEFAFGQWGAKFIEVIGRLRSGVEPQAAAEDLRAALSGIEEASDVGAVVVPLKDHLTSDVALALKVLLGTVVLVLLVTCTNVGTLLLGKSLGRRREVAVRRALGAGRGRILVGHVLEGLILAGSSGLLGLTLVYVGLDAVLAIVPDDLPRVAEVSIDPRVITFALSMGVLTGLLAGLMPGLRDAGFPNLTEALKEGGRSATVGGATARILNLLVVAEVAATLVLLTGAGLLGRSFIQIVTEDKGFNPDDVAAVSLSLPGYRYAGQEQRDDFRNRLLERTAAIPGVSAVAATTTALPTAGVSSSSPVAREGFEPDPTLPRLQVVGFEGDYFDVMQIGVREGRLPNEHSAGSEMVINEAFARAYYPGMDVLGRRARSYFTREMAEIVGVVEDVKQLGLTEDTPPVAYVPLEALRFASWINLLVRSELPPETLFPALTQAVRDVDPMMPITRMATMGDIVSESVAQPRLYLTILGAFGGITLLITLLGYYGVVSQHVERRLPEIGVRIALGARSGQIRRFVVGIGMRVTLAGLALGVVASLAATRVLQSLLYEVSTLDPVTFIVGIAILLAVTMAAMLPPLRRATSVNPVEVLNDE